MRPVPPHGTGPAIAARPVSTRQRVIVLTFKDSRGAEIFDTLSDKFGVVHALAQGIVIGAISGVEATDDDRYDP